METYSWNRILSKIDAFMWGGFAFANIRSCSAPTDCHCYTPSHRDEAHRDLYGDLPTDLTPFRMHRDPTYSGEAISSYLLIGRTEHVYVQQ